MLLVGKQRAFEEGGDFHGKTIYLFGCTERELPAVCSTVAEFLSRNNFDDMYLDALVIG